MRFYFFKTSMEERGKGPQPTLRALPGQTFPNGLPVHTELNVSAPKEAGSSRNGSRFEYPIGTIFASTHLELVSTKQTKYYTVYEKETDSDQLKTDPDFHPVSDDPDFQYVKPKHRNDAFNIAYAAFQITGSQEAKLTSEKSSSSSSGKKTRRGPADKNGNANSFDLTWAPIYEDQIDIETELISVWIKRLMNDRGVRVMAKRPKSDSNTKSLVEKLYSGGESADTIVSRERFDAVMKKEKMDEVGLKTIMSGPMEWYLETLATEHRTGSACSACDRLAPKSKKGAGKDAEIEDVTFLLNSAMNSVMGISNAYTDDDVKNTKAALEGGWNLDIILNTDILTKKDTLSDLLAGLANGEIALPKEYAPQSKTFLETIMADPKNARPTDKDGFHVDELTWKTLVRNLYRHQATVITGPTGSGKTKLVKLLCERTGTPLTIIPMGTITDPVEQLIGKMDLDPSTNGTKFDWADFALAIQRPGVILLDEINRCPRNGNNILFSVLDGTATLTASGAKSTDQRNIKVNKDCVFFATANIGYEYTGTSQMDIALWNRFHCIELDYINVKEEANLLVGETGIDLEDAENIATIAYNIRQSHASGSLDHGVSTRETLLCAGLVSDGFSVKEALESAMLPNFEKGATDKDPDCERGKVKAMIASRFKGK